MSAGWRFTFVYKNETASQFRVCLDDRPPAPDARNIFLSDLKALGCKLPDSDQIRVYEDGSASFDFINDSVTFEKLCKVAQRQDKDSKFKDFKWNKSVERILLTKLDDCRELHRMSAQIETFTKHLESEQATSRKRNWLASHESVTVMSSSRSVENISEWPMKRARTTDMHSVASAPPESNISDETLDGPPTMRLSGHEAPPSVAGWTQTVVLISKEEMRQGNRKSKSAIRSAKLSREKTSKRIFEDERNVTTIGARSFFWAPSQDARSSRRDAIMVPESYGKCVFYHPSSLCGATSSNGTKQGSLSEIIEAHNVTHQLLGDAREELSIIQARIHSAESEAQGFASTRRLQIRDAELRLQHVQEVLELERHEWTSVQRIQSDGLRRDSERIHDLVCLVQEAQAELVVERRRRVEVEAAQAAAEVELGLELDVVEAEQSKHF